jgi:hypothetical protein
VLVRFDRRYRAPETAPIAGAFWVVYVGVTVWVGRHLGLWWWLLIGLFAASTGYWFGMVALQGGLRESATTLSLRTSMAVRRWPWSDIAGFTHQGKIVQLVTTDERVFTLTGIRQGYIVVWQGGSTLDIVGVLQGRLAEWRAEQGDARDQRAVD